jgi:outer membrane protein insertion porin family
VVVDSIVVQGNERVPEERILEESGLRVGMQVSYPDVQDAIHRIFATGNFSDVRVLVSPGEPAVFFVLVEERPYVARYEFRGLQHVGAGTLRDTVGLTDGEPFSPSKVARAMDLTGDLLSNEGFPTARIDTSMVETGEGIRLVFDVSEGPRLGLAEIEFEGNESFSDGRLTGAMRTGEEGFLWFQSGELRRAEYEQDLQQRLPDFYARNGFIDFSVLGDTVIADRTTGKGKVRIDVEEGPRYRLSEFVIRGNRRFPSDALRQRYPEAEGLAAETDTLPPFDRVAFQEATAQVGDLYRNAGFLRANVVPTVERLPADSTVDGDRLVRVAWNIQEGEPAYIRHVTITGNDYTHDRIIRQRLGILPGDIYSQERLVNSIRNVQSMGFFEALPPQEAVQIEEAGNDVDITLRVKEKSTGNLNFGMSAAAGSGLAGFIGYEQPNLFGQAKSGRARLVFGGRTRDIELSYSDPQIFGTQQSLTVQLRDSRDEFRTFSVGERRQTGGAVEVGTPFPGLRSTRIFVGYSLFRDETSDLSLFGVDPEERGILLNATRSTADIRVVRDTRRGGTFPTSGNRNMLRAGFTGNVLGGNGDFGKYEFESEWFVPVAQIGGGFESNPIRFTAGIDFRGGFILGDNPFFRERFFMGGTNIGQQLRGYEEATVTPLGHVPDEARFGDADRRVSDVDRVGESFFATSAQFGVKLSQQLFLNTFVDAGNVWASASQFNPSDLLVGAGIGASVVTPFGPIGLDYAYGFDRRDVLGRPDPGWKLHFKFGRVF